MPALRRQIRFDARCTVAPVGVAACLCLLCAAASADEPPITAIAFAPDGQSVVVGSQAGLTVCSWPDLKQQPLDTTLVNIHDLAFSPDGQSLAVAGGTPSEEGLVEVVAWPGGQPSSVYSGHTDCVLDVAWMSDSTFATASLDHDVVAWNTASEEPTQRLNGHSRGVSAVCFLPQEQVLVSASLDQNLRVWRPETANMIRTLNNHTRAVHQLALRPHAPGPSMIASVSDDRTVRLWQPSIGRMVRFAQLGSTPLAVDWLADGSRVVVVAADGHVRLIDPDTVEITQDLPAVDGWAYSLGIHPTDGSLLVGGRGGQLKRVVPEPPKS